MIAGLEYNSGLTNGYLRFSLTHQNQFLTVLVQTDHHTNIR